MLTERRGEALELHVHEETPAPSESRRPLLRGCPSKCPPPGGEEWPQRRPAEVPKATRAADKSPTTMAGRCRRQQRRQDDCLVVGASGLRRSPRDRRSLIRQWPCSTLSYMKEAITVRLDKDVGRLLARVVKLSGRSQSDVVREALRRQLVIELFDQMRSRVAPFAEAQGLLSDEDVFEVVS